MDGTPLPEIPPCLFRTSKPREEIDAQDLVARWLSNLERCFTDDSFDAVSSLFIDDCWWRDIIGLSWDFTSKHGKEAITSYLETAPCQITGISPVEADTLKAVLLDIGGMEWIQGGFNFTTAYGRGRGLLKLVHTEASQWRAWSVFTQLESLDISSPPGMEAPRSTSELNGIRESNTRNARPPSSPEVPNGDFASELPKHRPASPSQPQVIIVGAGQSGLALGARLKRMNISSLLIERNCRLGDSWRKRYRSIKLHTPSYTDHYPFVDFPEDWPKFPAQQMIADFAENYGKTMGLDVRLNTEVSSISYDDSSRAWNVALEQSGRRQTLTTAHVVLATGVYADTPVMPAFSGQDAFHGQVYHSCDHQTAAQIGDLHDKRVAIVGAGPSAHDVAQDYVNHGAKAVSMVQRNAIFSTSMPAIESTVFFLWNIPGISTADADLIGNATPIALIRTMSIGMTKAMAEQDKDMIAGLRRAGLALKTGEDGYGLADHQLIKGGQYYIDQGANEMIVDGRIRVHHCQDGISHFTKTGISLQDGNHVEADVVVFATGYQRSAATVEKLLGPAVSNRLDGFGHLDQEQERSGWWRNTGVPGFWYMTGSFMWSRQFSLPLALQIAAVEHGLNTTYYTTSDPERERELKRSTA